MEVIILFLYLRPRQPRTKRDTLKTDSVKIFRQNLIKFLLSRPVPKPQTAQDSEHYSKFSFDLTLLSFFFPLKCWTTFLLQIFNLLLPCVPNRSNRFLSLVTILSWDFLWLFFSANLQDPVISCRTDFIVFVIKTDRHNSTSSSM